MAKIYSTIVMRWDDTASQYVDYTLEFSEYEGEIALCCGATAAQTNLQNAQTSAYTTMTQQAQQVFGQDSTVFNDLQASFAPIVAAGPNQQGFSAAENANLNSEAITETGQAYKNARQAVGEQQASQGGGNTGDVFTGSTNATNVNLATSAANQTASELGTITENNYATGRQNYANAAAGLEGATNSFNSATSSGNAATTSGSAAASTANEIAGQNNSWVNAVTGALGGIAGAAVTGGLSLIGSGSGSSANGGSGDSFQEPLNADEGA